MIVVICILSILPWIGIPEGTTTEDAAIATAMLETGDWFVPPALHADSETIAPMLHWLIAAFSILQGYVSSVTLHLPGALAFIALIVTTLLFFGRTIRFHEVFVACLLLITCYGIQKLAMITPVDILFTAFFLLSLVALYRWEDHSDLEGLPIGIPLLMSAAVLTRGFSVIILPLIIFGIYVAVLGKYKKIKIIKAILYAGISALFIPALWYIAAMKKNGIIFYSELYHFSNILWLFKTVITGFLPWTLLFVFSLFGLDYAKGKVFFSNFYGNLKNWIQKQDPVKLLSLIAILVIFLYYCIMPVKDKAYLLPAYPFIGLFLAQYIIYITEYRNWCVRIFAWCLAIIATLGLVSVILIMSGSIDPQLLLSQYITNPALIDLAGTISENVESHRVIIILAMSLTVITLLTVYYQLFKKINIKILYSTIALTFAVNCLGYALCL